MIKALRIGSIILAVFAVLLLVYMAVKSFGGSKGAGTGEDFVNIVDKFRENRNANRNTQGGQTSPLVAEAEKFSLYLNPPVVAAPAAPSNVTGINPAIPVMEHKPVNVEVRFNLVGTCYIPTEPNSSLALIDEAGKGLRWVRQSSKVGHLFIQEIKDGAMIVKDGTNITELEVPKVPKPSFLKGERGTGGVSGNKAADGISQRETMLPKEAEIMEAVMKQMKAMEGQQSGGGTVESPVSPRDSRNIRRTIPPDHPNPNAVGDSNAGPNRNSSVPPRPSIDRAAIERARTRASKVVSKDPNSEDK